MKWYWILVVGLAFWFVVLSTVTGDSFFYHHTNTWLNKPFEVKNIHVILGFMFMFSGLLRGK